MSELDSILSNDRQRQPERSVGDLSGRYRDAYRVARVTILIGNIIKGVALITFIIGLLVSLSLSSGMEGLASTFRLAGFGFSFVSGFILFAIGVLISAMGQVLLASLDGAVNTSPFVDREEKAKILHL